MCLPTHVAHLIRLDALRAHRVHGGLGSLEVPYARIGRQLPSKLRVDGVMSGWG
jgi:hypothetical protein